MLWVAAIASVAILPMLVELVLFRKNLLMLMWWMLIPLSVPIYLGASKFAPSEILLFIWLVTPLWHGLSQNIYKVIKHPVSILLLIEIAIYALATVNSTMPLVSLKRLIVHIIYIVGGYLLFAGFLSNRKWIIKMPMMMGLGIIPVFIGAILFASKYGFITAVVPAAPRPFFHDHTEFGAFAAFLVPILGIIYLYSKKLGSSSGWLQKLILLVVVLSVILSFSRAVWISVAGSFLLYFLMVNGLKFRQLLLVLAVSATALTLYSDNIYQFVLQNEAESDREEILEQIKSVGNVKSDVSNLERINRWKSSIKMFREKPLLGFGPGTYQFQYAPYQELQDKTVISTNFGDAGNAHSEYLMYLSETGIIGFLTFGILCLYILWLGFRLFHKGRDNFSRYIGLGLLLALCTFMIHSMFNSFLETDKIGLLFYLFLGALVALDIRDRSYNSE